MHTPHTGTSNSPKSKTLNPPISERPMPKKQGSWWVIGRSTSGDKDSKDAKDAKDSKDKDREQLVVAKSAQTQVSMGAKDAGLYYCTFLPRLTATHTDSFISFPQPR